MKRLQPWFGAECAFRKNDQAVSAPQGSGQAAGIPSSVLLLRRRPDDRAQALDYRAKHALDREFLPGGKGIAVRRLQYLVQDERIQKTAVIFQENVLPLRQSIEPGD